MKLKSLKKTTKKSIFFFILFLLLFSNISSNGYAVSDELMEENELRKLLPVQTDSIIDWPTGPVISAQAAFLYEPNTGTVLYSKNADEKLYPASTTKILTCILILEHCEMDEVVTFSQNAIDSLSWNDSNMGASVGDEITVWQALHAILVGSANEAAYAMAEHISGDVESFAELMNQKADEIGCFNTHFTNPSGLFSEEHYTTAHDLALIAKEFFKYDILCQISSTYSFEIPSSKPDQESTFLYTKNKLLPNRDYDYPYLVGSKTGYTSEARQTLVSCSRKDNMSLICVILKDESPYQFEDTVSLFDYGFSNFTNMSISNYENSYDFSSFAPFQSSNSIFGNTSSLIEYDEEDAVTIPVNVSFSALESEISFDSDSNSYAQISYYFNDYPVGSLPIYISRSFHTTSDVIGTTAATFEDDSTIFIQLKHVFFLLLVIVIPLLIIIILISFFFQGSTAKRKRKLRKRRKSDSPFNSYKF